MMRSDKTDKNFLFP